MEDIKKGQELENIHHLNKTQEAKKCPHCAKFKNCGSYGMPAMNNPRHRKETETNAGDFGANESKAGRI